MVLALVGTDHHPFDRMVDWADAVAARLGGRADVVVQHGHTHAPHRAGGRPFWPRTELDELLALADVVICHGGPATIADARDAGHVPLCVPRDPELGEHVDGHQQRFVATLHGLGVVVRAETESALVASTELWVTEPGSRPAALPGQDRAVATRAFAGRTDVLLSRPCRRRDPLLRSLRGLAPHHHAAHAESTEGRIR